MDAAPPVVAHTLKDASSWWQDVNQSPLWQDRIFHVLAAICSLDAAVALVQLIRIQLRVPEYGWTTQKARAVSTDGLRLSFCTINTVVYAVQIALWLILCWKPIHVVIILSKMFFAGVSLFAAVGFLLYHGRCLSIMPRLKRFHAASCFNAASCFTFPEGVVLFLILQCFPVDSKGCRKKLQEVGYVTATCFTCSLVRFEMVCFNAFNEAANVDVLDRPVLNFIYYLFEILPSLLVLFILRKLPPKRGTTQYHPIR